MGQTAYLRISGSIFALVAAAHLIRAINHVSVTVGSHGLPTWLSWVAALVGGTLCGWAFRLAARR